MISAKVDQVEQDILIEKYMTLPNQVWDEIINHASKVSVKTTFFTVMLCYLSPSSLLNCKSFVNYKSSDFNFQLKVL